MTSAEHPALWRPMTVGDVAAALALAGLVHPDLPEGAAMYRDRIAIFPRGCLVLEMQERLAGYALGYPAPLHAPPPLDVVLGRLDETADAFYIHDIALHPDWQRQGLAEQAVEALLAQAEGLAAMLVSVHGTSRYWERFGFRDETDRLKGDKLASYGPGAVYMVRPAGTGLPENPAGSKNGTGV